jgi:tetratricopeptide (TPR) repeat protein
MLYLSQSIPGMEHLENVFVNIWVAVHGADMQRGSENDVQTVLRYIKEGIASDQITFPRYFEKFIELRLQTWVESAFVARGVMGENDSYRIGSKSKDVVTMDKNTGVQMANSQISEGIHQFLQLKHLQRFTPESLKSIFISNTTYFKMYKTLSGLSGTLGSEAEKHLLADVYGVDVVCVPTFKARLFRHLPPKIATSVKRHKELLLETIDEMVAAKRPVLIVNNNIAAVKDLKTFLSSRYPKVRTYYLDDTVMNEHMAAGEIVISTNLAGRGTDIKVSEEVNRSGGLHVILTYCPSNLRIEKQAFGRAGRKGQNGSGQFIVLVKGGAETFDLPIFNRNQSEKFRLSQLRSYKIAQIALEENLLRRFQREVLTSITDGDSFVKEQRNAYALERFAFWLDQQKECIVSVKDGCDDPLKVAMDVFIDSQEALSVQFKNPHYFFLIGKYHLREGRFVNAIEYFQSAIRSDPDFSEFAEYYKAGAIVKHDQDNYRDAIKCMKRARHKLMSRMIAISSFPRVMQQVKELQQRSGKALSSDLYAKQIESRMEIYNPYLNSITTAVGADGVDIASVVSAQCSEDQAKKFQRALLKHEPLFRTHYVLISEFDYTHEDIKTKLKGCDFTPALKLAIAEKILTNSNKITATMFEDMLPNADDLFSLLESNGILVANTIDYRNIKELLCVPLVQAFGERGVCQGDVLSYDGALCSVTDVSDEFDYCIIDKPKHNHTETKLKIRIEFSRETGALMWRREASTGTAEPLSPAEPCMLWRSDIDMSVLSNGMFKLIASNGDVLHSGTLISLEMEPTSNSYVFTFVPLAGSEEAGTVVTIEFNRVSGEVLAVRKGDELLPASTKLMFQETAFSTVQRGCQATIESLFSETNRSFTDVYTGMDGIKETLLAQAGVSDEEASTMLKIRKCDVQILTKKMAAEKLVGVLETKCVLSPPNINDSCKEYSAHDFEVKLRDCLGTIMTSENIKEPNNLIEDYVKVFETFKTQLACDIEVKYRNLDAGASLDVSFTALRDDLQDGFNFSLADELSDMELRGLTNLVKFIVKPPWWGPLVVFLLGWSRSSLGRSFLPWAFPTSVWPSSVKVWET